MDRLLTIKDAPMFSKVMEEHPELCKGVLESILGIEIDDIRYQNSEQTIEPNLGARGVRLDVYVKSTGCVFDIEMQFGVEPYLDMRMRYYQAAIDSTLLNKGGVFKPFERSYVIFICAYDAYERGYPIYHIDRMCREDMTIDIEDASHWVVLNSRAWAKDDDAPRSRLLQYVQDGTASDALTEGLASAVKAANDDVEWRESVMGFMTLDMSTQMREHYAHEQGMAEGEVKGKAEGLAEGIKQGEVRYSKLVDILLSENRIDDLKRAADDPEYRQSLFKEYVL